MIMANLKWILLCIFVNVYINEAHKILVVFPFASRSHSILGDNMARHLLEAGHEVTYITPYNSSKPHPNLTVVDVSETIEFFASEKVLDVKMIMDKTISFNDPDAMSHLLIDVATDVLETKNLQAFIRDPKQKFDAVVGEWLFSDLYSVFGTLFDCPLIWVSPLEPHWIISDLIDGPLNPAYSGDYMNDHVPPFTFIERIQELWVQIIGLLRINFVYYYKEEQVYHRLIAPILKEKGKPVPSYQVVRRNASLVLGNSQVAIGHAVSLPQGYKHVGGYHIEEPVRALPEEIFPNLPENIHIVRWAPQQSILAHPNTVLFISHGGLLSVTETIHFGVPIITIPVFGDQFLNAVSADKKGFGKKVDLSYTMDKDIKIAIDEVLGNPKYTAKVKELSQAYHDGPMKPKEELVYWINHVIKTGGAPHLRSPALQLHLYQRLYLDLVAVILISLFILKLNIQYILSKTTSTRTKKEKRS